MIEKIYLQLPTKLVFKCPTFCTNGRYYWSRWRNQRSNRGAARMKKWMEHVLSKEQEASRYGGASVMVVWQRIVSLFILFLACVWRLLSGGCGIKPRAYFVSCHIPSKSQTLYKHICFLIKNRVILCLKKLPSASIIPFHYPCALRSTSCSLD